MCIFHLPAYEYIALFKVKNAQISKPFQNFSLLLFVGSNPMIVMKMRTNKVLDRRMNRYSALDRDNQIDLGPSIPAALCR